MIQVNGEALSMFDHGKFLVDGTMERGCKPLLTIRFAPSSKKMGKLWNAGKPVNLKMVEGIEDRNDSKTSVKTIVRISNLGWSFLAS